MQQENVREGGGDHIREAVAVFDDIDKLNKAVTELETTAFPRHDISVLDGLKEKARFSRAASLEDDPDAPRTVLIRPEEKAVATGVLVGGGFYAGVATGIVVAGGDATFSEMAVIALSGGVFGAALGALIAWLLGRYYNGILQGQINRGQLILWVRTPDPEQEQVATEIMRKHGGQHVHIHEIH